MQIIVLNIVACRNVFKSNVIIGGKERLSLKSTFFDVIGDLMTTNMLFNFRYPVYYCIAAMEIGNQEEDQGVDSVISIHATLRHSQ